MFERKKNIRVPQDVIPGRIDIFLVQQGVGLSRSQIQRFIREGRIKVIGKGTKPNFMLRGGETIELDIPEEEPFRLLPEDIPIEVVFEDEYLIVINKPFGMVTHPARGNWKGTLINAVLAHTKTLSPIGGDYRPGVVHRLDKDTSGLIIVAKKASTHIKLSEMLSKRLIDRQYLALLWGRLANNIVEVDQPIGRHPKEPLKRTVLSGGQPAKTIFFRLATFDFTEFVRVKLLTGRTHQIRVHANFLGHPVFGDVDYGGGENHLKGISPECISSARELLKITSHQLLHAWRLQFKHPETGTDIVLSCELPEDFTSVIQKLAGDEWEKFIPKS